MKVCCLAVPLSTAVSALPRRENSPARLPSEKLIVG